MSFNYFNKEYDLEDSSEDEAQYEDKILNRISFNLDQLKDTEQEILLLLFHLAERCTSNQSYTHHGVSCNQCGMSPLHGVRFRCIECPDFDLCRNCQVNHIHEKVHSFLKIQTTIPLNFSSRVFIPSKTLGVQKKCNSNALPEYIIQGLQAELLGNIFI